MNNLFTITKTEVKKIENFFLEFEGTFAFAFQDVDLDIYEKEIKFNSDEERMIYTKENKLFHNYFEFMYVKICNHLMYQLQSFEANESLLFLKRQKLFKGKYEPNLRKKNLKEDYLIVNISHGDESILEIEYNLDEYELIILGLAYEAYEFFYNKIEAKINEIYSDIVNSKDSIFFAKKMKVDGEKYINLRNRISELGFFTLPKTSILKEEQKQSLIEILQTKNTPYVIAIFSYLGFIDFLYHVKFKKKEEAQYNLSQILEVDVRTIRGLISVLSPKSKENITKYATRTQLPEAIEDFKAIIQGNL
jgi:hypothetical protein